MLTFFLSRVIIKQVAPTLSHSLAIYIPLFFMVILFSQYEHRLTYTLAWLLSLMFIVIYLRTRSRSRVVRSMAFMVLCAALYYAGAGFFLIFTLTALLFELLYGRNYLLVILFLVVTLVLPLLSQNIFVLTTKGAYFYLLLPVYDYRPSLTPYVLYIYFPLFLIFVKFDVLGRMSRLLSWQRWTWGSGVLVIILVIVASLVSFDTSMHRVLKVDALARGEKWQQLLEFVDEHPSDDILVAFQTNRALYHVGRLSTDMFGYNQNWGLGGLFLPDELRKFFSIQVSDLYWDMGFLNEAEHWAQEDHTNFFFSPWHVKRLASTSILKGNMTLATMCLDVLEKSILYRSWAEEYRTFVEAPQRIDRNPHFTYLKTLDVKKDFIITPANPESDIEMLLKDNPKNRVAFEFLMADYLLTFRLGEFVENLQSASHLQSRFWPKHYQEAVLVYLQSTQWQERKALGKGLSPQTVALFNGFMKILQQHKNDAISAQTAIRKKYGDTYWYYSMYNNPSMRTKSFQLQ